MRSPILKAAFLTSVLALAACGNTTGDRGPLVGAPAAGAAIGGAVGAAIGAFTDEKDINLGKPIWE
jgi:hypothetical protein